MRLWLLKFSTFLTSAISLGPPARPPSRRLGAPRDIHTLSTHQRPAVLDLGFLLIAFRVLFSFPRLGSRTARRGGLLYHNGNMRKQKECVRVCVCAFCRWR